MKAINIDILSSQHGTKPRIIQFFLYTVYPSKYRKNNLIFSGLELEILTFKNKISTPLMYHKPGTVSKKNFNNDFSTRLKKRGLQVYLSDKISSFKKN